MVGNLKARPAYDSHPDIELPGPAEIDSQILISDLDPGVIGLLF